MGQVRQDKVDRMITFEHSRWESYNRTQQMKKLHQDTVDETVDLEDS